MTDAQETAADTSLRTTGGAPRTTSPRRRSPCWSHARAFGGDVRRRPRPGDRRLRRGHRPGGRRRRARLRVSLRSARLPRAAAPREGAGSALVDPVGCPDLSGLGAALDGTEWILHAATQDLPCLRDIGMTPTSLFDTELAGRLAGLPACRPRRDGGERPRIRPGEGPLRGRLVHPPAARALAALRRPRRGAPDRPARRAGEGAGPAGKLEWAREEFDAIAAAPPAPPRKDPWRRTSGHAQGAPPPSDGRRPGAVDHP